jgi:cytosine/uracil/thiamine/allantoin permease
MVNIGENTIANIVAKVVANIVTNVLANIVEKAMNILKISQLGLNPRKAGRISVEVPG